MPNVQEIQAAYDRGELVLNGIKVQIPPNCPYFFKHDGCWMFSPYTMDHEPKNWSHDREFPFTVCDRAVLSNQGENLVIASVARHFWLTRWQPVFDDGEDVDALLLYAKAEAWAEVARAVTLADLKDALNMRLARRKAEETKLEELKDEKTM
jgi:hypothetical protein